MERCRNVEMMDKNVIHGSLKRKLLVTAALAAMAFSVASADDHVVVERTRSGMGMRFPTQSIEIWLNDTALCIRRTRLTTIERYDLQKRWILSPEKKRYFEEPLNGTIEQETGKDTIGIQRAGWDYTPHYDWTVKETQQLEVVTDQQCRLIAADGDADYSNEFLGLWVTDKAPVDIARFNERVTPNTADFNWHDLIKVYPLLDKCFIMKSINRTEPPIAPEMTYEMRVTKLENTAPPPGTYEVPDGFQKANSMEELNN